ncbi:CHAP domain-containing protein [Leucobacter sp.]
MLTEADLATYVERVRYQWIDVDRVFGAQCWDQWSHYATTFLGVSSWPTYTNAGGTWPHQGYACNVYHNARAAGLERWFEILPANATPRAGDVAFWEYGSAWYPWSHVATVLAVTHGGRMLRCLTQNPGAVQVADLITSGIIGYLRPRALTVGNINTDRTPTKTASQKEEAIMNQLKGIYYMTGDTYNVAVFSPISGFFMEYVTKKPADNNNIATGFGTGSFTRVTDSLYNRTKTSCAAVRAGKA